ncbi:uncharacterized protein LOC113357179 isoform X2 [Papaver somniferum]|uniref:uncharacterized protein LOC113357179 isoform X2 n=1 Tax=Papaver somniferum TaxID=3469 RepID=UPI000E702983|nr:uncharacterized protein LOC113357179 isoform X2 [Papaver somniferum]
MVRTLVQLMRTLDRMPEERTILMKLLLYEDVTPIDYKSPFFIGCSEQEANNPWLKNPLKMEIGNVNSKHFVLALKVKSILDPCQDENNDMKADEMSHSANDDDGYIVASVDDTRDAEEDEHQLKHVRDWISSHHIDNVELTDVFSSFPDISVALTEESMDKLVYQNILSRTGKDSYSIGKLKKSNQAIVLKEEMDVQVNQVDEKVQQGNDEDYLYLKALYHVLPLDYVTVSKLQSKLEGEVNQATVHKMFDKMACDGYVEAKSKPRLGKHVIRSELTDKKLLEVKNVLEIKLSAIDTSEPQNVSTCGGLHSVGSDLTRTRERSAETHQMGSSRIQELLGNNTSIRRNEGFLIYVNFLCNKTLVLEVLSSESVHTVKAKIHFKEGIPPSQQCLFFRSKELTDGTLAEYCITKASTLHILLCLRGGGSRKKEQKKARKRTYGKQEEQEKAERITQEQAQKADKKDKKDKKKKQHEENKIMQEKNDIVLSIWRAHWDAKYESDERFLDEESLDVKREIQLQETEEITNNIMAEEIMVLSIWETRWDTAYDSDKKFLEEESLNEGKRQQEETEEINSKMMPEENKIGLSNCEDLWDVKYDTDDSDEKFMEEASFDGIDKQLMSMDLNSMSALEVFDWIREWDNKYVDEVLEEESLDENSSGGISVRFRWTPSQEYVRIAGVGGGSRGAYGQVIARHAKNNSSNDMPELLPLWKVLHSG